MGISKFMILVIIFTIAFLFVEKDTKEVTLSKEEKPKVSFFDSTMYDITETNVQQVVKSKQADIYNNREELIDAVIVVKSDSNNIDTNIVSGKEIIKRGDTVYLSGDVRLQLPDGTNVKTEELQYNTKTKVATNNVDFVATRNNDRVNGNSLYLDSVNEHIKAEKTKFRMKVKDE